MDLPFATLTPVNALAKMALSDVYDAIMRGRQGTVTDDIPTVHRISVDPEQKYHKDVLLFRKEMEHKHSERDTSESPTEPDTDTEIEIQHLGMIWTGHYILQLQLPPHAPDVGWIAGKWSAEKGPYADIFFCTKTFAKCHGLNLRSFHARFNFALHNRAFFIASINRSSLTGLAVNGEAVGRQIYSLNQHRMTVRVDSLEYLFQYTDFASSKGFIEKREEYLTTMLGAPSSVVFDMPTPRRNTRTIGQWTLGDPLGKGSAGKVFLGSNSKNEVVAVKIIERTFETARVVDEEIARCRDLTALAQKQEDGGRLVRLKEIIDPREASSLKRAFEDVALVLEPMTPQTLSNLIGNRSRGGSRGMLIEAAAIFRDALLGVEFLHNNGWLHRDIKPQNIGVLPSKPPRAVLLDVGQAKVLAPGFTLPATPGRGGTVNYLAPEREMTEYDHTADVWPMAIIGYELTYGSHPFKFAANPWRPGEEYVKMRPAFQKKYEKAIDEMSTDYDQYCSQKAANKNPSFIHLGGLLVQMLRHSWAQGNNTRRINVNEALQHPAWGPLLADHDDPQAKRARFDRGARR